ncbi:MAG: YdcH family protein [Nitrospinae bacterium]|nr:YdcH family protein [Nitrospinota bacterium]
MAESPAFCALVDEHNGLDREVRLLMAKHPLTPAEEQTLADLKKRKLAGKDRLVKMLEGRE